MDTLNQLFVGRILSKLLYEKKKQMFLRLQFFLKPVFLSGIADGVPRAILETFRRQWGGGIFWLCVTLCYCSVFTGCDSRQDPLPAAAAQQGRPFKVVVTTAMVGDIVRQVAGSHVEVVGLMGEGVDPHLYRPTANDTGMLMKADLIVYSGLKLEGPMEPAFQQAAKRGKSIVAVTSQLTEEQVRYPEGFEHHPDPHVWGDVALWAECIAPVEEALSQHLPEHAEEFRSNAQAYRSELLKVDSYAKQAIASIPQEQRFLVTAHDAFEYFATAYGIEVRSVQGITTESDPGVQDINRLVDFLVAKRIPAIFVEATVNEGNIQAVIEGARQRGWEVEIGGTLYSDSLGAPGTYEGTYIGMMDSNITTIARALGGRVPERGLNGKLPPQSLSK